MQCAAHPAVDTDLGCSRCGKGICARCLVHTPVGARCRDCANVRRIPTYHTPTVTLARAFASAIVAGVVVGVAWWIFNPLTYFFFGIIPGLAVGFAVGEATSLGTNRRAGPPLQAIAVGGAVLAYLVRVGLLFAASGWIFADLRTDLAGLVGLGVAAFIAAGRLK
ncbi:MAG: hypothetical protein IVW36_11090 [Dehalococcoidia bacterium]|nr:hypothetical protein [Dehalococcoidia bacterium]